MANQPQLDKTGRSGPKLSSSATTNTLSLSSPAQPTRPSSPLAGKPITNQSQSNTSVSAPSPLSRHIGLTRSNSPPHSHSGSVSGRTRQDSSSSSRSTATSTSQTTTTEQSDYSSSEDYNHYKPTAPAQAVGMGSASGGGASSSQPISISTSISPISSIQPQTARLSTTPLYPSPLAFSSGPADDHDHHKPGEADDDEADGDSGTQPSDKGSPIWAKHSPRGSLRGSPLARDGQILFGGKHTTVEAEQSSSESDLVLTPLTLGWDRQMISNYRPSTAQRTAKYPMHSGWKQPSPR